MLACVCAEADERARLLRALVGGLTGGRNAREASGGHVDGAIDNCSLPQDRAVWCGGTSWMSPVDPLAVYMCVGPAVL
jgi:hypothetical protein